MWKCCLQNVGHFGLASMCIFNTLWPTDAIWQQTLRSTLAQVMACCLTAASHYLTLVAYGSGKRMVTGTRAGSRIQTRNFKRRFLPHHKSQRRDIWCTNSPVVSCFNPKFVDRSVPYEAKQRRVKFRRCFGNIPLAECNVSVPNVRSSGTEPKAPVTDYRNRGSGNHTRG